MTLSMRRIFSVLAVAALMAAMIVASVMPAMAAPGNGAGNRAKHFDAVYLMVLTLAVYPRPVEPPMPPFKNIPMQQRWRYRRW